MVRPHVSSLLRLPRLLRFRLTLWYTGLAALVLAIFVAGVSVAFNQYQDSIQSYTDLLTQTFNQQVQVALPRLPQGHSGPYTAYLQDYYGLRLRDPDAPNKGSYPMAFFDVDGKPLGKPPANPVLNTRAARTGQQAVAKASPKKKTPAPVVTTAGQWRFITIPLSYAGNRVIGQIAVPVARIQDQVTTLLRILIFAVALLLAVTAVGGWLLVGRALKPVDQITRRARQITERDLSSRLNVPREDELGRMAMAFDDMISRLDAAFERQKRFAADASHELRTPLAAMRAEVGLALARPRATAAYRQTLESVEEDLDHLTTIVNDLLTLTRIDVDRAALKQEAVALDEILRDLIEHVEVIAMERAITVETERLDVTSLTGDATRLRQLFTNLLDNAVTYTGDGGRVTVALEQARGEARVRVSDTGIGIAPDEAPHVFERFYRSPEARSHNPAGTGLGLAIARAVVQAHRGNIHIESVPGAGTTVTVTLPMEKRRLVAHAHGLRGRILGHAESHRIA